MIPWINFAVLIVSSILFTFFYVLLHFLVWLVLDQGLLLSAIAEDILKRPFITIGFLALLLLFVVGTVALGGYFLALIQDSIWYQRSWATTARYLLDGFIYALGTAAIFAWLWP